MVADPSYAELVQHLPEDVCEEVVLFASRHVPPGVSTLELPVERDRSKRKEVRILCVYSCICAYEHVSTPVFALCVHACVYMCLCVYR